MSTREPPPPPGTSSNGSRAAATDNTGINTTPTPRITPRPTPHSQLTNPRTYQLSQLRRRYHPVVVHEHEDNGSTVLDFPLRPSDPDFPFEMDALLCSLVVARDFPPARPTLRVRNPEMERGYQVNVERGWDRIVEEGMEKGKGGTLLAWLNRLDRELEGLLARERAETGVQKEAEREKEKERVTLKVVRHGNRPSDQTVDAQPPSPHMARPTAAAASSPKPSPKPSPTPPPAASPDAAALSQARHTRDAQVQQLQARMGRLPQFSKSPDGLSFTIPIQVHRKQALPLELQAIKQVRLFVPETYNIEPCRVQLVGVSGEAKEAVERGFEERARRETGLSLVNQVNYLAQNMHVLARGKGEEEGGRRGEGSTAAAAAAAPEELARPEKESKKSTSAEAPPLTAPEGTVFEDRPHVIVIPRPPEWDTKNEGEEAQETDSSSSESGHESESEDAGDEEQGTAEPSTAAAAAHTQTPERGVLVSFPHLELHGIELLEIVTMNITVKCERCKDTRDITNLLSTSRGATGGGGGGLRREACAKCAASFGVGWRAEFMHANSARAGYLDLEGCVVLDLLPSNFIPTCAECSTAYPRPGVVSVRGETSMAFCRECHRKMTFRLPEIKFLRTSTSAAVKAGPVRKKKAENLGIVAGRELPNRGRCTHYKKSYRWFRFSCCNKVFACDRCHDQVADHVVEHANRMIWYVQNFRPKDCGICHAWLTVRPGKGFWEGGQGTRDRVKMSRKDPRKYKRVGGSKVGSS
ncbi:uncharacterized protein EI97DRAFT_450312 [Westerdykella ornata]|uniref:CHY-type domain-containing protein n=1 Tax=Westerdykella ornata TaxID=318751 RepID=A0A6A6JJT2_WESOR|nr:uncharacterized protein EI97DRAFT_450312 [Westerdykella ornata]KAF2276495.1 hypothetical protein EI97DRAFT_450312 [Westerdykella ornata]